MEPKFRFKREDGTNFPNWEKLKLRDITAIIKRKSTGKSNTPIMMISQGNGFIYQSTKYSRENAGQSLKNYTLLKRGEFAYNHGASKAKPYGVAYCLNEEDEALVPFVYHTFSLKKGNWKYWNYALNTIHMDRQLRKLVSSGARMDGLLNINYDTYMNVDINVPCIEEQEKIASLIFDIDIIIMQSQEELSNLERQMKAVMEKIFSQEAHFKSSAIVKIGEWKKCTIADLVKISGGKTPSMNNTEYWNESSVNWISSKDMKSDRIRESEMKISNCAAKEMKVFSPGTLLFVARSGILKRSLPIAILNCESTINQDIKALEVFGCMPEYLFYYLKNMETFILHNYVKSGTTVQSINVEDLLNMKIDIPSQVEQEHIVSCLSIFSEAINLSRQELDKWKELKKGLLQQMFV